MVLNFEKHDLKHKIVFTYISLKKVFYHSVEPEYFFEATPNLLLYLDLSLILKGISSRTVHHHCWYPKGLIKLIFVGFCSYNETPIHPSEMYLR